MNIGEISLLVGMVATVLGAVGIYTRWRATVVYIEPHVLSELQSSLIEALDRNRHLEALIKEQREQQKADMQAQTDAFARSRKECEQDILRLTKRVLDLERATGNGQH